MLYLVKNKRDNKIVYTNEGNIDLFTIYNLNLKRNYPDVLYDCYEVITEEDSNAIKQIQENDEVYIEDGKYRFVKHQSEPVYQIDQIKQLQCQIQYLQKQINDLKGEKASP